MSSDRPTAVLATVVLGLLKAGALWLPARIVAVEQPYGSYKTNWHKSVSRSIRVS